MLVNVTQKNVDFCMEILTQNAIINVIVFNFGNISLKID